MKGFSYFLDLKRCRDWDREISSRKYLSEDLLHQFPWWESERAQCLTLRPEFSSGGVEGQQLQQHRVQSLQRQMANALVVLLLANALGKCQFS